MKFSLGQAVARIEDPRLLTGQGQYTNDLADPKCARLHILRSPRAHAAINRIDVKKARAADGVLAVYTGADLAAGNLGDTPCLTAIENRDGSLQHQTPWPVLARERVRFVGDAVAAVVAETLSQAKDAAELIDVDYQSLPAITDTEAAANNHDTQLWDHIDGNIAFDWHLGDADAVDAAFTNATHVTKLRLVNNRVVVNSMEPRPIYAVYDAGDDRSTLYSSTQGPAFIHEPLASMMLNIDKNKLRLITTDVGGGFGMKVFLYPEHALTTWISRTLKRAISYCPERTEAFTSDVHGRDHVSYVEAASDNDGVISALRVTTYANMGAYLSNFGPYIPTISGGNMLPGCYRIPACYNNVKGVMTNSVPVDAYRGAGRPEASYLIERLMDVLATERGLDVAEIRRRNFIAPEQMPYTTPLGNTYDSGDFAKVMDTAMAHAGWHEFDERRAQSKQHGKLRGIGMAVYIERCGGGDALPAQIVFNDDDTVTVLSGTQSNGQGHETAFTQIVCDTLAIDADKVHVVQGDTDRTPSGFTGGSRSLPIGGSAVLRAAEAIIEKGKRVAASALEAAEADVVYDDGRFAVTGTDIGMDLFAIARAARDPQHLAAVGSAGLDSSGAFASQEATYPNGCHICELEVDADTGVVDILAYRVVDDFGKVINPKLLAGQVHGGIAQGIGQALFELAEYDHETGQLLTGSFMDYTMPRADDIPYIEFTTQNVPCADNPFGIKGAGEAGAVGAPPAVVNAVVNALQPATGITHIDMPARPQTLWSLLHEAAST